MHGCCSNPAREGVKLFGLGWGLQGVASMRPPPRRPAGPGPLIGLLILGVLGVALVPPLLGAWVASTLAVHQGALPRWAVAAGLGLSLGLPLAWEALSVPRRRAGGARPKRWLRLRTRLHRGARQPPKAPGRGLHLQRPGAPRGALLPGVRRREVRLRGAEPWSLPHPGLRRLPDAAPAHGPTRSHRALTALAALYALHSTKMTPENPMIWALVMGALVAFVAYGRYVLKPVVSVAA